MQATVSAQGRLPPRIGNIGHITRIGNKLSQLANNNSIIKAHLQVSNRLVFLKEILLLDVHSV